MNTTNIIIMKNKFTKEQVIECKWYLGKCIDMGCIDEVYAKEIIDREDWNEVYKMMDKAEYYAEMAAEEYDNKQT